MTLFVILPLQKKSLVSISTATLHQDQTQMLLSPAKLAFPSQVLTALGFVPCTKHTDSMPHLPCRTEEAS